MGFFYLQNFIFDLTKTYAFKYYDFNVIFKDNFDAFIEKLFAKSKSGISLELSIPLETFHLLIIIYQKKFSQMNKT